MSSIWMHNLTEINSHSFGIQKNAIPFLCQTNDGMVVVEADAVSAWGVIGKRASENLPPGGLEHMASIFPRQLVFKINLYLFYPRLACYIPA